MLDLKSLPNQFLLTGQLLNVFQSPTWEKAGQKGGGDYRLQIMSVNKMRNGESKTLQTDVSIGDDPKTAETYRKQLGAIVKLPVSVYAQANVLRINLAAE